MEPPADTRQALRGNLYAIVELTGDNPGRDELSERMLSALQRTYYTAKGSQAEVMRAAVDAAQRKADEFNQLHGDHPLRAGIICVGLLQSHLLMLHSGPALALIGAQSAVDRYPADILNFDQPAAPDGEAEFYRHHIEEGAALFLGGAEWLDEVPIRTLAATVAYLTMANCGEAARGLRDQYAIEELPGIFVVIEPEGGRSNSARRHTVPDSTSGPVSDSVSDSESEPTAAPTALSSDSSSSDSSSSDSSLPPSPRAGQTDPASRGRESGLPTAVHAAPPVRDVPPVSTVPPAHASPAPAPHSTLEPTPEDATVREATMGASPSRPAVSQVSEDARQDFVRGDDIPAQRERNLGSLAGRAAGGLAAGVRSAQRALRNFLPDRSADDDYDAADDGRARQTSLFDAPPDMAPPEPARGGRARLFVLLALLILVLVPVVVLAVSWGKGGAARAEAEALIDMASAQFVAAQDALDAGDGATGRSQLEAALNNLSSAEALIGSTPEIGRIRSQIEVDLQDVLQVRALNALVAPLVTFPADAMPSRVLSIDQDIYVLDTGRQLIERYRLDLNQEFIADAAPLSVIRAGDAIDGVTVGRLVDMAWQPAVAGIQDKPGLLVLDRNNQFFRYDPRVEGATFIALGDPSALQLPNQIGNYGSRTYVADEGTQQIMRYEAGGFGLTPTPWFAAQTATNLTGLRRMAIDGDIWLLYPTGIVLRYNQGESVPFSIKGSVAQIGDPIDMAVGQQSDIIYIADAAGERIFTFDKSGSYLAQYTAPEAGQLANLRGLYLDDVAGKLFILTQSALFQVPPPNE